MLHIQASKYLSPYSWSCDIEFCILYNSEFHNLPRVWKEYLIIEIIESNIYVYITSLAHEICFKVWIFTLLLIPNVREGLLSFDLNENSMQFIAFFYDASNCAHFFLFQSNPLSDWVSAVPPNYLHLVFAILQFEISSLMNLIFISIQSKTWFSFLSQGILKNLFLLYFRFYF